MYNAGRGKRGKQAATTDGDGKEKVLPSSGELRLIKDWADFDPPIGVKLVKTDKWNEFSFIITPQAGSFWHGGTYEFTVVISKGYPIDGPTVRCIDKIYHPNIGYNQHVCVSALKPWKPHYTMQFVSFGLMFLFTDPNPMDVLEAVPAEVMRNDVKVFAENVKKSMKGQSVDGEQFPKNRGMK